MSSDSRYDRRSEIKTVLKKIILSVLLVLELFSIFFFSSQDSEKSSEASGVVCEIISRTVTPDFDELPKKEQEEIVAHYQFTVRKGAHMTEFALLAATLFLFFIYVIPFRPYPAFFSGVGFCAACAFFDELHQSFVPGRSMQITDMLIDIGGGVAGALIAALIRHLVIKRAGKKTADGEKTEV